LCRSASRAPNASDDEWQVATPESMGLDGAKLRALAAKFDDGKKRIREMSD
jgi:hypothetical protein